MKNFLTTLALVLAAATPAAFIIELAGTALPAIVDSSHLFGALMLTFVLKILVADYAGVVRPSLAAAPILALPVEAVEKGSLRLAA